MDQSGDSPPPLLPHQHHRNNTVVKGLALPRTLSSRHRLGHFYLPTGKGPNYINHRLGHVYLPTGYGPKKNGRGGHGSSCLRRIMCFCSGVFCQGFRRGRGFRSGCWLPLGSAMGPRCACRGEAGVVRGGRGANGRGGHGSSCLHRIMFFCSGVFCQGFRRGKDFRSGCWLPFGSAMGPRCACRGEAGVVRGGANGRGGHGSSYLRRIMFICSGVFCQGFRKG